MVLHRYFFALQPDDPASDQIDLVSERLLRQRPWLGPPMARGRRHVSLNSIGRDDAPMDDWAERAIHAAARIRPPAFDVAFNRIAAFAGRSDKQALVLRGDEGVVGVDLLQSAIHAALADAALAPRRSRPFEAHLTLARGRDTSDEAFIRPIRWTVREFVLIHSYVGQARYEIAARFPLAVPGGGGAPTA